MEQVELFFEYNAITDATEPNPEQTTNDYDGMTVVTTSSWRIEERSNTAYENTNANGWHKQ